VRSIRFFRRACSLAFFFAASDVRAGLGDLDAAIFARGEVDKEAEAFLRVEV
jgi:hypothetical protein